MRVVSVLGLLSGCTTIGAGQAGVLWRPSTGTVSAPLAEGLHFVPVWERLALYDLRTQEQNEKLTALASNGLAITIDATIHYHVDRDDVAALHKEVGPSYYDVVIGPVLRSRVRRVVGRYTPEEIYSSKRDVIEWEILEAVDDALAGKHLSAEVILIRNVELPTLLQNAIVEKLAEEQRVLAMKYLLEHARLEVNRKVIEAEGLARYQDVVAAKLTEPLLRWKRIEALERLALSKNTKVVMMSSTPPKP